MKRAKSKPTRRPASQSRKQPAEPKKLPFIEHLHELRKRLFYIAVSIIGFAGLAFYLQKQILAVLRHPAGDQIFITTTPGGAFNFLFTICIAVGLFASIPVIVYQILRYAQPVVKEGFMRLMIWGSVVSGVLAVSGAVFGYVFGLPNSLRFLFGQSSNLQIEAMITIDSYASFVTMYLLGAAILFQVPLILYLINRIKPLKPSQLLRFERPFIVMSLVFGAIISPSPNIQDMLILAIPTIVMYQFSMVMIWFINRKHRRPRKVVQMLKKDAELQAERIAKFQEAQQSWQRALQNARTTHHEQPRSVSSRPAMATAAPAPVASSSAASLAAAASSYGSMPKQAVASATTRRPATTTNALPRRATIRRPYVHDAIRQSKRPRKIM